jgi:hypothetical protein
MAIRWSGMSTRRVTGWPSRSPLTRPEALARAAPRLNGGLTEGGDVRLPGPGGAVADLDRDAAEPLRALADGEVGGAAADHVQVERPAGIGAADHDGVAVGGQPGPVDGERQGLILRPGGRGVLAQAALEADGPLLAEQPAGPALAGVALGFSTVVSGWGHRMNRRRCS